MTNIEETNDGAGRIKVSRKYSVAVPKDEGAYLVAKSDWDRIKTMVAAIVPAKNWFQVFGSISIGIALAAIFSLIGFAASKDVPNWAKKFEDWCALVCGTILAVALFILDSQQYAYTTHKTTDVTSEMDRIEEMCRTTEGPVSTALPAAKLTAGSTLERLGEIRFDHPGGPLDFWQFTSDDARNTSLPKFSGPEAHPGGLTMAAPGTHHIDLELEARYRPCKRLRFQTKIAKDCPESYVYARVEAKPVDGKPKSVWIACDVGNKPPAKHGPDECIIYRQPSDDGWAVFDLNMPDEVRNSPLGQEYSLEFTGLLAIRLRGSISVSPIELYR